jgi:hypothetical protein
MNDQDRNLIAAFAEGTLDPSDTTRAEELISAREDARLEYEAQTAALAALRAAPTAVMSADERSSLRAAIAAELHLEPAPEPAPVRPTRRWGWTALAGAAAAFVLLVAVGGSVINALNVSDEDRAADTTIAQSEPAEAAPAATEAAAGAEEATEGGEFEVESAPPADAQLRQQAPAPAAESDELSSSMSAGDDATDLAGDGTMVEPVDIGAVSAEDLERFAREQLDRPIEELALLDRTRGDGPCAEEADAWSEEPATTSVIATATVAADGVVVYAVVTEDGDRSAVGFDTEDCSVSFVATP